MASAQKIVAVPTLADLLSDPARISALPKDVIAELRGQIAKLDTLLLSQLLTSEHPHKLAGLVRSGSCGRECDMVGRRAVR